MALLRIILCASLIATVCGHCSDPERYERIEENLTYQEFQDVRQSLNYSDRVWLLHRNYKTHHQMNDTCVYAKRNTTKAFGLTGEFEPLPYEMGYKNGSESIVYGVYLTPEKTGEHIVERKKENAIYVQRELGTPGRQYVLIYYSLGFGILRVREHHIKHGNGCELHVRASNITQSVPGDVEDVYKRACGSEQYKVYDESCEPPPPTRPTSSPVDIDYDSGSSGSESESQY